MICNLEKSVHDNEIETLFCKPPGLKNPETFVLTHNRFNTYMVLTLSDLKTAQSF